VFPQKILQIHAVKLIPREYKVIGRVLGSEMDKILAYRIGCSLEPAGMFKGLLRGQYFHKAVGKNIKVVGLGYVEMEGRGIELGKYVNLPEMRVDTV
jgi:hypothetical protein